ncbi:MAG: Unknown protein [uncultured Sulfurovum sp.]|uniref:Highly acidic protein n=1 Tax=uncultured Sulfurovum sp. TaxID=269237 RepID=A0A6S6TR80_9BACT|nr:MAG: Unknown protein [uncultured Sulfurovum sp.]
MHILLINNNPVVSRLLMLCTRDANHILEEVEDVAALQQEYYDFVFIDEALYEGDVLTLDDRVTIGTKILFSNEDVQINAFDMTIKKPFLPSQILELFDTDHSNHVLDTLINDDIDAITEESQEQVLDDNEIEKIKDLLEMDDYPEVALNDEEYEERKIELIKAKLEDDGLEVLDENQILDDLDVVDDNVIWNLENEITLNDKKVHKKVNRKTNKKSNKNSKKELSTLSKSEQKKISNAIYKSISKLKPKKIKKFLKGKKIDITISL